jgi:hypothetical protein
VKTIKGGRQRYLGWSLGTGIIVVATLAFLIVMAVMLFTPTRPANPCGGSFLVHGPHGEVDRARAC